MRPAIRKRLKDPSFRGRLYACALMFIGAANLAMLVGPAIVINVILSGGEGLDPARFRESLELYVQQIAVLHTLGTGMFLYLLLGSALVSSIYVVSGVLMYLRKAWVRQPLLWSFAAVILFFIVNLLIVGSITGRFLPNLHAAVTYLVIPLTLWHRFTREDAGHLFEAGPDR